MSDSTFVNLCASVPTYSMIVIEELDKQWTDIKEPKITLAALVQALGGIPRLNHGVIVMATANRDDFVTSDIAEILFRPGRIDAKFNLNE